MSVARDTIFGGENRTSSFGSVQAPVDALLRGELLRQGARRARVRVALEVLPALVARDDDRGASDDVRPGRWDFARVGDRLGEYGGHGQEARRDRRRFLGRDGVAAWKRWQSPSDHLIHVGRLSGPLISAGADRQPGQEERTLRQVPSFSRSYKVKTLQSSTLPESFVQVSMAFWRTGTSHPFCKVVAVSVQVGRDRTGIADLNIAV